MPSQQLPLPSKPQLPVQGRVVRRAFLWLVMAVWRAACGKVCVGLSEVDWWAVCGGTAYDSDAAAGVPVRSGVEAGLVLLVPRGLLLLVV